MPYNGCNADHALSPLFPGEGLNADTPTGGVHRKKVQFPGWGRCPTIGHRHTGLQAVGRGERQKAFVSEFECMFEIPNMRFRHPFTEVLGSPIRVNLLRELARANGLPLSGRELARRVSASPSQVNQHLQGLRSQGLVTSRTLGRVHSWSLAAEHALAGTLRKLFDEEPAPFAQMRERLEATIRPLPVERAILFGSIARGDERPESDIDVFVETRGEAEKEVVADALSRASLDFAIRFGNPLSSLILTRAEVRSRRNPQLLASIDRDGLLLEV